MPKQPRPKTNVQRQSPICKPAHRRSSTPPSTAHFEKLYGANYLDISQYNTMHSEIGGLEEQLTVLRKAFWSKRELIAMTGAGISVNAGGEFLISLAGGILTNSFLSS